MAGEVAFLGPEWLGLVAGAYADLPPRPGADVVVEHTVTGVPGRGDVTYWTAFEAGRLVGCDAGARPDATVTMTAPYALAAEVATGAVEPGVAVMQGRAKVRGDEAALLRLLALTATPAYRAATRRLAEHTRT
ncbi:MAG TPA: SCP2 sterol-binding domain-containing protein [Acidimicrobiales bacterium]